MGRKSTRAKQILEQVQQRRDAAGEEVRVAREELAKAQAVWDALSTEYIALQVALAPKPRQQPGATKGAGKKRASAKGQQQAHDNELVPCAKEDCRRTSVHAIHDKAAGYSGYHPFVPPAQPATPQSPPNGAGAGSTASTGDETVNASLAAETGG